MTRPLARWLWVAIAAAVAVLPLPPLVSWSGASDIGPAWAPHMESWGLGLLVVIVLSLVVGRLGTRLPARAPLRIRARDDVIVGTLALVVALAAACVSWGVFARNPPLVESRLVRLAPADFTRVYPPEVHDRVALRDESQGFGSASGEGELWRALAMTMLAALLLESLLAWRFGRR